MSIPFFTFLIYIAELMTGFSARTEEFDTAAAVCTKRYINIKLISPKIICLISTNQSALNH